MTERERILAELEEVRAAISEIVSGAQSGSVAGQSFGRADLKTLYERETLLMRRLRSNARGLGRPVRFI